MRKLLGVICDKNSCSKSEKKDLQEGSETSGVVDLKTITLAKRQETELEGAELKMLRFSLGLTRMDRIRNEHIRCTASVRSFGDKVREARLRLIRHVRWRDTEYLGRRMLKMEQPGRRQRGRSKRRFMDMQIACVIEDIQIRDRWRTSSILSMNCNHH